MDLKSKGKGKESYYLLLEYNPNYQTIEGIFKLKNIKELNFWKKVDLKTKVYSAVIQSIVKLYEEYNFAHSDLKTDNVMVDTSVINELNNDSNIDELVINVKNFDFDHAMFLDELLQTDINSNFVVIMAGGRGKRLRPLTDDHQKTMINVKGKPMIEHIIEGCKLGGFRNFYWSC